MTSSLNSRSDFFSHFRRCLWVAGRGDFFISFQTRLCVFRRCRRVAGRPKFFSSFLALRRPMGLILPLNGFGHSNSTNLSPLP